MKKITKGLLLTTLCGAMMVSSLTAGGSDEADSGSGKKVVVAVSTENAPYSYMNADEEIEGYEYAILCEIKERIKDDYDMEIVIDEWSNLLVGVDTGNYAAAGGSFGYKDERAEKYSYASTPHIDCSKFFIGYLSGRTDITDMKSLAGMTVAAGTGTLSETIILDWNEANPDYEILIENPDGYETVYAGMENGLYDAYIATAVEMNTFNSQYDNFMDVSDEAVYESEDGGLYFIFSKDQSEFQAVFDAALAEMKEDGTLAELCTEWIGEDLTE